MHIAAKFLLESYISWKLRREALSAWFVHKSFDVLVKGTDLSLLGLRSLSTEHGAWLALQKPFNVPEW